MTPITLDTIHKDLEFLKNKINKIEKHMTGEDTILTEEDIDSLKEAEEDLKQGKTKRL